MEPTQPPEAEPEAEPLVDQPGLGRLREAVATYLDRRLPRDVSVRGEVLAGLSNALSNVPDGMANAVLVGVSPIFGLYATMAGPAVGGVFSSTQLMIITTTAAASLSAGQALVGVPADARENALALMVLLIGVFQILFGLLRFGGLIRFVSYSVTTGFLSGVATLLILNQLPLVTGYQATGSSKVGQAIDLLLNLGQVDLPSAALAALTLALAVLLPRTRVGNAGRLLAIVVPSVLVSLLGLSGVRLVRDVGSVSGGLPTPHLPPSLEITAQVITGALAVAAVILVQGAGVSQSVPNPDGSPRGTSRDFVAQGAANLASGLMGGLPVGGSQSATALNLIYGARSRGAAILAGLWMAAIVAVAPGVVSYIAMPALGALLILAGGTSLRVREALSLWRMGWTTQLTSVSTFLATLFLPIQAAVGLGVVLSALLYLYQASADVSMVALVRRLDGRIEERRPPERLPSGEVTVLDVYGHLFYAGARALDKLLPSPEGARNPVVILRLRGRTVVGATLVDVLASYADKLEKANGRLYLSGVSKRMSDGLARSSKLRLTGPVRVHEATPVLMQSTEEAYSDARAWLVGLGAGDAEQARKERARGGDEEAGKG